MKSGRPFLAPESSCCLFFCGSARFLSRLLGAIPRLFALCSLLAAVVAVVDDFCSVFLAALLFLLLLLDSVFARDRETRTDGGTDWRTWVFVRTKRKLGVVAHFSSFSLWRTFSCTSSGAPAVTSRVWSWLCRTLCCLFCLVLTSFLPCLAWLVTCGRNSCYNYLLLLPSAWLLLV